jgi:hypothetical protein
MASAKTGSSSWPSGPAEDIYSGGDLARDQALPGQWSARAVIGEMAGLLRDTRGYMLMGGGVLGAVTVGIALEAAFSARALRPGVAGVINAVLLCGLLVCWLRAAILLALAGRPVLNALSELRWGTGAPLDLRPRWTTLPPAGTKPEEWTWIRAHLLLGAARLARQRFQLADTWTYVTAACFLVWTAVILLGL